MNWSTVERYTSATRGRLLITRAFIAVKRVAGQWPLLGS